MSNRITNRPDVYSRITDKIIADLERGIRPWMRAWMRNMPPAASPAIAA